MQVNLSAKRPFPAVWDNTMRCAFVECPRKFFYSFYHGLVPASPRVDLHAGAAFATGMEQMRRARYQHGKDPAASVADGARALITAYGDFDPGDSPKTAAAMMGALQAYIDNYGMETDSIKPLFIGDKPMIEFSFAHPLPIKHPETGDPIIYCGRFDMVGVLNDEPNSIWAVDEKTTKQLGPTWSKQWSMRSQFMGYTWGLQQHKIPARGAIVRGVSILKRGYGHAEAIVPFAPWQIDRWYHQLLVDIQRAVFAWDAGHWDYDLGNTCSTYGGCAYQSLCETPDPQSWIHPYFEYREWDPLRPKTDE